MRILQPHSSIFQLHSAASAQESALSASTRPAPNKVRQSPRFHPVNHGPTLALTAGLPHRNGNRVMNTVPIKSRDGNAPNIDRNHEHQPAKVSNYDSGATTSAGPWCIPKKILRRAAEPTHTVLRFTQNLINRNLLGSSCSMAIRKPGGSPSSLGTPKWMEKLEARFKPGEFMGETYGNIIFFTCFQNCCIFFGLFPGTALGLHPKSTVSDSARHSQSLQASFGVISKARSLQTSALSEDEKRSAKEE